MILLIEHDSGIDGWDARQVVVAVFDNILLAEEALTQAGYTAKEHGHYYHPNRRQWMNTISYKLQEIHYHNEYTFK